MKSLKVSSSFTWSTSDNIQFTIHNIPAGVLRISSGDESRLYLKSFFAVRTDDYTVSVVLPTFEKDVMINSISIPVSRPLTDFTFPNIKSQSVNYSMSFNGTTDWIKIPNSALITSFSASFAAPPHISRITQSAEYWQSMMKAAPSGET